MRVETTSTGKGAFEELQRIYRGATEELQRSYKGATRELQGSYKGQEEQPSHLLQRPHQLQHSTMADLLKSIIKLEVSGDGRTADNYNSYKVQLENALSAKEMQGIYLDNNLLNRADGVEVPNPGTDMGTWISTGT